jgi:diamine N-acetyltransferase
MTETVAPGKNSQVSLREVTEKTVRRICNLSDTLVGPQRKMVAHNAVSIAQAHFAKHAWFRAIYADETPVGFIMLNDDADEPVYFLWRLMIATPYQKLGYGRRAVELLIEYVKTRPGAKELLVSCGEGEGSPEGFYRALGFERTGEMEEDEVVLRLKL